MTNSVGIGPGWHAVLFRKEASQLADSFEAGHAHALVCDTSIANHLISRSSLISEVLSPGGIVPLKDAVTSVSEAFLSLELDGSIAVKSGRTGDKIAGWSGREVAGEIGGMLVEAG
ncbi:MAG: hypothetical protein MKZ56_02760, partial [Candidatus Thalassarchaeum sp.]|nr:hypothetical protein [Candidatus Thalassarchaeum sp.]